MYILFTQPEAGMMKKYLIAAGLMFLSMNVLADVSIKEPWARATVPAQKVAGGYMQLTSTTDVKLLKLSSTIADHVELHESSMVNGVMKMRYVEKLQIPAGKLVEFKPGGYHIMFIGLKKQLVGGDKVPLKLLFADHANKEQSFEIFLPVRGGTHDSHEHMHH